MSAWPRIFPEGKGQPNPAGLAVPNLDTAALRKWLRESLEKARGCIVELIMKDNHTLAGRPENAVAWCRIAREEAERLRVRA